MKALLLALLLTASTAFAEPFAQIVLGEARIVLYTDPCELPAIKNLPKRAEWIARDGKVYVGCFGVNPFSLVIMYFDDLTVEAIPKQYFVRVTGV